MQFWSFGPRGAQVRERVRQVLAMAAGAVLIGRVAPATAALAKNAWGGAGEEEWPCSEAATEHSEPWSHLATTSAFSEGANRNTKSFGKRDRLRTTCSFSLLVGTS